MPYHKGAYKKICDWLSERKWKYTWDEDTQNFLWEITLDKGDKSVQSILHVDKDYYISYAFAPFKVCSECRYDTLRLLNEINCRMIFGCFEMNNEESEVRFRMPVDCATAMPNRGTIEKSIVLPALMFSKFGGIIADVAIGKINSDEAIQVFRNNA